VGPKASQDVVEEIKISFPCQESNPNSSAVQSTACCYIELSWLLQASIFTRKLRKWELKRGRGPVMNLILFLL
jgi:hypothetical protein